VTETYGSLGSSEPLPIWDGLIARAVLGEASTLAVIELDPDVAVPEHAHANEQLGVLATGQMTFTIDGETKELHPGDTWLILANVPHSVVAGPEGAVAIESFAPAREDWADRERLPPSAPRWPK
jgi:quercetin dioxygenase-like cupin family protein